MLEIDSLTPKKKKKKEAINPASANNEIKIFQLQSHEEEIKPKTTKLN